MILQLRGEKVLYTSYTRVKATWVVCILLMEPQHAHGQPLAEGGHYGVLDKRYCIQVSPKD